MTEMMLADVEPISPEMAGVHAELLTPAHVESGEPVRLTYHLTDGQGRPLTDLTLSHEEWIHLVSSAKNIDGVRVALLGKARVGDPSELVFVFSNPQTGEPVTDLKPYLSAAGHVIVASQGLYTIDHTHGEAEDASGSMLWPLPRTNLGPQITFHYRFPTPGLYKVWGQFQTADGRVLTADFVVGASAD